MCGQNDLQKVGGKPLAWLMRLMMSEVELPGMSAVRVKLLPGQGDGKTEQPAAWRFPAVKARFIVEAKGCE